MEKINIAELLKDCPKGMELDCTMFENLVFIEVDSEAQDYPIVTKLKNETLRWFTSDGRYELTNDAKCVIFPKGKTTWEGFTHPYKFKDGDLITMKNDCGKHTFIYNNITDIYNSYGYYVIITSRNDFKIDGFCGGDVYRLATEEERQKLFDAIRANGFRWNPETKTLEKLIAPKFKIGDEITKRNSISNSWIVSSVSSEYYGLKLPNGSESIGVLTVSEQDDWELISIVPKFKVGNKIIRKGRKGIDYPIEVLAIENGMYKLPAMSMQVDNQDEWELASDKFDINTLKIFESRVLVRDNKDENWKPAIFGGFKKERGVPYVVVGGIWFKYLVPYEGNEHLSLLKNDCDDFYKTWE